MTDDSKPLRRNASADSRIRWLEERVTELRNKNESLSASVEKLRFAVASLHGEQAMNYEPKLIVRSGPLAFATKFDRTAYQRDYMRKRRAAARVKEPAK